VASTRRPWVTTSQDRSAWGTLCHEAVTQFEDSRVEALEHKRAVRKGAQPRSNLSAWPCDSCSPVCSSRIGLHAHNKLTDDKRSVVFDGAVRSVSFLSVPLTLVDYDHIGWNSSKIISRLVSVWRSLSVDPNIMDLLQGSNRKIGPKVTSC